MSIFFRPPLWPAKWGPWLLPHKGGDWLPSMQRLISPLEGEMAGRPEGGVTAPAQPEASHA
jgi:hypothetical protein